MDEFLNHLGCRRCWNAAVADGRDQRAARLRKWMLLPDRVDEDRRVDDDHVRSCAASRSRRSSSTSGTGIGSAERIARAARERREDVPGRAWSMASRMTAATDVLRSRASARKRRYRGSSMRI